MAFKHLTARDFEIAKMMAIFGNKTFDAVLEKTFFIEHKNALQQTRNRITKLIQHGMVKRVPLNFQNPGSAIVLRKKTLEHLRAMEIEVIDGYHIGQSTIFHSILEQITFYWLQRSGREVERTTISKHSKKGFARVPDMMYHNQKNEKIYVEIELNHKSTDAYLKIIEDITTHDNASVLYVFENEKRKKTISKMLPIHNKIFVITIDELIEGVLKNNKINAQKLENYITQITNDEKIEFKKGKEK